MAKEKPRTHNQLRKVKITKNYIKHPQGSVLIESGDTRVICTVCVEEKVPSFLRGKASGWITAEYSMLPGATNTRTAREATRGKVSGRTMEIQRLIGRSIRSVINLQKLGERTLWIDCDVIQADGGTRCASITGAFVATVLALQKLKKAKLIETLPVHDFVAAVSVGIVGGEKYLDLDYPLDSSADVDMNVVKTGAGKFVEIQGTAEQTPFDQKQMIDLLALADKGIKELIAIQKEVLGDID
jgi:ribonuclease PH